MDGGDDFKGTRWQLCVQQYQNEFKCMGNATVCGSGTQQLTSGLSPDWFSGQTVFFGLLRREWFVSAYGKYIVGLRSRADRSNFKSTTGGDCSKCVCDQ